MANLKSTWLWTRETLGHGFSFTEEELLACHEMLTWGTYGQRRWELGERPGQYKHHRYEVAEAIPDSVREALAEIRNAILVAEGPLPAMNVAAYAHALLVDIHPFADGNGHLARQIANMVLLRYGLPPVLVPKEDRMAYFDALDAFHHRDDLNPLAIFLIAESLKYWSQL